MVPPRSRSRSQKGTTLVEMAVVLTLLGTAFGSLLALGSQSTKLVDTGIVHSEMEVQARRALERLSREIASSSADSLAAVPLSTPDVPHWEPLADFDRVADFRADDGRITWSTSRVELRYALEEVDNGIDDDADGLVDEGMLVLIQDFGGASELELVLARNVAEYLEGEIPGNSIDDNGNGLVDERGAAFERRGGDLRLHLSLESLDGDRRHVTRTLTTTVLSRN
jgi:hypothetical protein